MKQRQFEIYAGKLSNCTPEQIKLLADSIAAYNDRNNGFNKSYSALDEATDGQINLHMSELSKTLRRASGLAGDLVTMFGSRKHHVLRNTAIDKDQAFELSQFTKYEYNTEHSKRLINEALRFDQ